MVTKKCYYHWHTLDREVIAFRPALNGPALWRPVLGRSVDVWPCAGGIRVRIGLGYYRRLYDDRRSNSRSR